LCEKFARSPAKPARRTPEEAAEGFITIAVENMANAIKKISVQRGYDVTAMLLNCFGGAGGQHACLVADALGMTGRPDPPVLGPAVGLWHGPFIGVRASRQQALLKHSGGNLATDGRCADRGSVRRCAGANWQAMA
jgi:5-oxoprolinase (ATP-hydrolysing)